VVIGAIGLVLVLLGVGVPMAVVEFYTVHPRES
jgi:hypothetical protein